MHVHPIFVNSLRRIHPVATFSQDSSSSLRTSSGERYFVKLGAIQEKDQYVGEAESLKDMHRAAPGLVPTLIECGIINAESTQHNSDIGRPYFISEYKDIGPLPPTSAKTLGKRLATEMHAYKSSNGKFGFHVPTYCGATRQENGWFETWTECFDALIGGLVDKLEAQGGYDALCRQAGEVRERVIPVLLGSLDIPPVLLHGDLWGCSGNTGVDRKTSQPVIFDPSSYYGHNEADLAIGRMFGGIPESFFATYHEHLPKSEPQNQYKLRQDLYQLYHYLNHTVLFGGSYASSALRKMDKLLGEVKAL